MVFNNKVFNESNVITMKETVNGKSTNRIVRIAISSNDVMMWIKNYCIKNLCKNTLLQNNPHASIELGLIGTPRFHLYFQP
jgi:hypothetical protein